MGAIVGNPLINDNTMLVIFNIAFGNSNKAMPMPPFTDVLDAPDTKQLQFFDQLYSSRSLTRTAEQLGVAQPTVSIWLAKLRLYWGDALFVRSAAGMLPTPRADALVVNVREALQALARLSQVQATFDPASTQRRFRIAMTDGSHTTLLPQLLSTVRGLARGIRLEAARIDGDLAVSMQSGDIDLALGLLPQLEAGFYQQTLYAQDWVCLANAAHPRLQGQVNSSQYQAESHIHIASGTGADLLQQALLAQQIQRSIALELPGFLGLSAIVSSTDLLATLPRQIGETLARMAGLQVLACPFAIAGFNVKQHWHARYHEDNANRWLRGVCAGLFLRSQ